ncbi:hypothetical protein COW36_16080 [bacterium (Candidatus Blackallbacteria) CG17_big_fil_post_rev_8_21_14_2_50_48_46]|uniref:Uncharacterized protein n=1 Tax=bacterium (Candidatus Blackallbacteria) CG17_big_fil_post_rev_8_21_14_2_50_48_46 TaxID=2014261 RepID=A0A2M7G1U5_9BACT|nr:MAG: hypothetical protein COW64_08585 [bacterium (Candidatus Blackallbacteria) CG18_big_fil_WC_8_21_14_2_50_49_26]PIW15721.1 MAG: hypothetical protein COW36_16080 [bacterium (Candidatus Blackallbacteria) CG17_big_fil_post_rev_8_21_14_2_50_48_46]PIW49223.1 MAG: hypothetical protein COW20_06590 [bacterium (Candidatus Blackallbacteria) CG13_big_fil_rev_8_21_14_2_50_49_14]
MHHLIFQATGEDENSVIPYAQSGDFVKALMSFDAEDLDMGESEVSSELFLLKKICELKKWPVSGDYPRFYISQKVEVTLTRKNKAFCRVLNARSHETLEPLSMEGLQEAINACFKQVASWKTNAQAFMKQVFELYSEFRSSDGAPVALADLYQALYHQKPGYRREHFGLDLNHCLNSGLTRNQSHYLSVIPATSRQGQSFYVFDTTGTGQWVDQIAFLPLES